MTDIYVDSTIYTSKPDKTNRLSREMEAYEMLDRLGIGYLRIDHDETASIEVCHGVEMILDIEICKNLFLCNSQKDRFFLLVMPGNKKFESGSVSRQINSSRLSFAPAEYMEGYLNLQPGSVSILGLMYDKDHCVKLLIDRDLLSREYMGCHPCVNTSSLKIKTSDILEKFLPYTGHVPEFVEL